MLVIGKSPFHVVNGTIPKVLSCSVRHEDEASLLALHSSAQTLDFLV